MIRRESSESWKPLTTSNRSFYANHVHAFRLGAAPPPVTAALLWHWLQLRCEKRVVSRAEERDVDNRAGKYILRFTARLKAVTIALPNPPTNSHGSACSRAQHCNQSS